MMTPQFDTFVFILLLFCFFGFSIKLQKEGSLMLSEKLKFLFNPGRKNIISYQGAVFASANTIVIGAIFVLLLIKEGHVEQLSSIERNPFLFLLCISLAIALFFLFKMLLYRLIGLFFLRKSIKSWTNNFRTIVELMGILLFFPVLFGYFIPESFEAVFIISLIVLILSRLLIFIHILNIFIINKIGLFYFFVYLCGTEVAPYLLSYRVLFR